MEQMQGIQQTAGTYSLTSKLQVRQELFQTKATKTDLESLKPTETMQ